MYDLLMEGAKHKVIKIVMGALPLQNRLKIIGSYTWKTLKTSPEPGVLTDTSL